MNLVQCTASLAAKIFAEKLTTVALMMLAVPMKLK